MMIFGKRLFLLIAATACMAIAGVAHGAPGDQADKAETGKKGLKVTVLLYSGRPNPTFILEDKESIDKVKSLVDKSKALKSAEKGTALSPILGYNGIVVENLDGSVKQFPVSMHVHKGDMEVKEVQKMFMKDEANGIEDFLLKKAMEKKVIDEKTLKKIKGERK